MSLAHHTITNNACEDIPLSWQYKAMFPSADNSSSVVYTGMLLIVGFQHKYICIRYVNTATQRNNKWNLSQVKRVNPVFLMVLKWYQALLE